MSFSKFDVMDRVNNASSTAIAKEIAAIYIDGLAKASRMAGEPLTKLEEALSDKARAFLISISKKGSQLSDKARRVMRKPKVDFLVYVAKARAGGHEIPEAVLKLEAMYLEGI